MSSGCSWVALASEKAPMPAASATSSASLTSPLAILSATSSPPTAPFLPRSHPLSLCLSLDSKSHVFITVIVDLIEFQFRKLMSYATQSENTNLMLDCIMVVNYEIIL